MECPKKEYYFVSNLTDSHEYEYIKPIGEFLVEFLNADLEGYPYSPYNRTEIMQTMYGSIGIKQTATKRNPRQFLECSNLCRQYKKPLW